MFVLGFVVVCGVEWFGVGYFCVVGCVGVVGYV